MKTNSYIKILFFAILSSLYSCGKEEIIDNPNGQINQSNVMVLDNIPFIENPYDIADYIINPDDKDDEKINGYLLDIAKATRDLLREESASDLIHGYASKSANSCIDLLNLEEERTLKSTSKALSNFKASLEKADLTHVSQNPLKSSVVEEYIPAIHFINVETADITKQPIICPGFEVNSDLPGLEDYEDYIVGWFYDESGNLKETLLSEETVMNTEHPVFIIDNAEKDITDRAKPIIDNVYYSNTDLKATNSGTEYHSYEYMINQRYDKSDKSEFCVTIASIDENGTVHLTLKKSNGTYTDWNLIYDVPKSHMGNPLAYWKHLVSIDVTPHGSNFTYWNTFERDWYASKKNLGSATANSSTIYLGGNMSYSNEWYSYDPDQVMYNPMDYSTIYNSWAKWHNSSKSYLRIWRVGS